MKPIVIKDDNIIRINDAIKSAEGRATERRIKYENLSHAIFEIEHKLDIPKSAMVGCYVNIDYNAQKFPRAYKYTPQSTHAIIQKTKAGWNLVGIRRDICRTWKYEVALTNTAKQALIDSRTKF